ncbi:MAG: hypothetical protein V2B18_09330 [Pseudomonadota bacterium]
MSSTVRSLSEISERAIQVLTREIGVVDTIRFLGQFSMRSGDYTEERGQWLDDLSLDSIIEEIRTGKSEHD